MSGFGKKLSWRLGLVILLFLLVFCFLILIRSVLFPFFLALIIAYLLEPMVEALEKRGMGRVTAILTLFFVLGLSLIFLGNYGFPRVFHELNKLMEAIPRYTLEAENLVRQIHARFDHNLPNGLRQVMDDTFAQLEKAVLQLLHQVADGLVALITNFFDLLLTPLMAFYFLKDWNLLGNKLVALIPNGWKNDVFFLWRQVDQVLRSFIRGHLITAGIVALATTLAMMAIGMDFAIFIGLMAGVFELVPYFGPILGTIPAVALALLHSPFMAMKVIVVMFVIQLIEGNILSPKILGESVGLHPLVIIFALLAGQHLMGILGMLLAVPMVAIARIVFNYLFLKLVSLMKS